MLHTYTGKPLAAVGTSAVVVVYKGQKHHLCLLVEKGNGPTLLGRDWLSVIQLDWAEVRRGQTMSRSIHKVTIEQILCQYPDVMEDGLGTLKGLKGRLLVDPDAVPRFFKPRAIPYALRDKVEDELKRLQDEGIIEPVPFSDWAAPIVPIVKADKKSVRICGDFKVTVNRAASVETYPLPRVEDLYAKLSGGQKFSKLDLRHAYLQVELEEESKKYVTINTSRPKDCSGIIVSRSALVRRQPFSRE